MSHSRAPNEFETIMLLAGGSGAIESLERFEQARVTSSFTMLPRKGPRAEAEALGFVFGENINDGTDLFVAVTAPEGWDIKRTDHSMWSNYVDQKGRVRGKQFYKGAFYDLDAFYRFEPRYQVDGDYEALPEPVFETQLVPEWKEVGKVGRSWGAQHYGYDDDDDFGYHRYVVNSPGKVKIVDGTIYELRKVKQQVRVDTPKAHKDRTTRYLVRDRATGETLFETKWHRNGRQAPKSYTGTGDYFMRPAYAWLDKNFPEWKNNAAYWD